jgi:hypothetical protein
MSFGKALLSAFGIYIALNLGLNLAYYAIAGTISTVFTLENILSMLFVPPTVGPYLGWFMPFFLGMPSSPDLWVQYLFQGLIYIVPPLLGALIAGKTGEETKTAFGAWLLVPIITAGIAIVIGIFLPAVLDLSSDPLFTIIAVLVNAFFVGLTWSGIAAVTAGP